MEITRNAINQLQNSSWIKLNWRLLFIECWRFCKIYNNRAKLHVPIVTLPTKDNIKLTKQLNAGFKRSVYWNSHQTSHQTIPPNVINKGTNIYELLNAAFQGVKKLFLLAHTLTLVAANNEADIKKNKKYFIWRAKIKNYNVMIEGRNFYDQPVNDLIKP